MRWWPIFTLAVLFLLFLPNYKEYEQPELLMIEDGCLIYSLHHKLALEAKETLEPYLWTRVLAIHFYGKVGHAVNVFVYKNFTYVYDPNVGTYPLYERPIYDPLQLAEIIYPKIPIRKAYFLEPTMLLQYQTNELQPNTDSFRIY
jgi:hypothetical protein